MRHKSWHILREEGALTLCRQTPARFDVAVTAELPLADPLRVAQQVRQDMWRAVQNTRGFSPVVRIERSEGGLLITAGGRVAGRVPSNLAAKIAAVLEDESKRQRWVRHAQRRVSSGSGLQNAQQAEKLRKCAAEFDKGSESAP